MPSGSTDIRYVCLSDMHLGEEDSLLTNISLWSAQNDDHLKKPSPVMQKLVECLRYLVSYNRDQTRKPTLIMLGDILELALATDNQAAMVFERFLELALESGRELFDKIIYYIPGNHDHHLWESARETQYVLRYLNKTNPGDFLEVPWRITKIFMENDPYPVPSFFLNGLLQRYGHLQDYRINTVYPNFGLMKGDRCVIFHHGHFIESIYQLMTTMKNLIFPEQKVMYPEVSNLEAENFAWIDFFWSTLGRSGDVGRDIEIIYEKMQNEEQFRNLINTLAESLAMNYGIADLGVWINDRVTKMIINGLVDKMVKRERTQFDQDLSQDAIDGLSFYANFPLHKQIDTERTKRGWYFPWEVSFVFGHTHKPFETVRKFDAYRGDGSVSVYNTGGWVVETVKPAPRHGGAVVLLNENLDIASLRLYNEADNAWEYQVKVHEVPLPGRSSSHFSYHLQGLVQSTQYPWKDFPQTVAEQIKLRSVILKARISA